MTPQKETALHIAAAHDRASIAAALLGELINFDAVDEALNNGNSIHCVVFHLLYLLYHCCHRNLKDDAVFIITFGFGYSY